MLFQDRVNNFSKVIIMLEGFKVIYPGYLPNLIEVWAAASLAIGTLNGEQLT